MKGHLLNTQFQLKGDKPVDVERIDEHIILTIDGIIVKVWQNMNSAPPKFVLSCLHPLAYGGTKLTGVNMGRVGRGNYIYEIQTHDDGVLDLSKISVQ